MALARLVLRQVIHDNLQTTIDAAVVEIESKAANFKGLAAPLVLARVDTRVESFEKLVVPFKERPPVNLCAPQIDAGP